ncbi:MAG: hypothetical protein GY719_14260 [bacterium]|nr:hypothetical protein [bacterium]
MTYQPGASRGHRSRPRPVPGWLALALLLAAGVGLGACSGTFTKTRQMFGGKVVIEVAVDEKLNEDFPIEVDFLVIYDRDLLAEIQKLDAATWFDDERKQYLSSFQDRLDLHHWEWVPGRSVEPQSIRHRLGARAGVVFARYFSTGDHSATIDPLKPFYLDLGETDFEVGPLSDARQLTKLEKIQTKREKKAARKEKKRKKRQKKNQQTEDSDSP